MSEAALVFVVLGLTIAAFASDRLRLDVVALLAMLALVVSGVLSPEEAIAGFAEPVTLLIAGLFVVGAGLLETGVADRIGDGLARIAGRGRARATVAVMLVGGTLSAFMSNTGTVAVLLPVVASLARRAGMPPSRLLMPLAFGATLGGMTTLIGSPPNLIVSDQLRALGHEPFGFFAFAPVGVPLLLVGTAYMVLVGGRLLPAREEATEGPGLAQLAAAYELGPRLHRVRLPAGSALAGRTLAEAELRSRFGATVLAVASEGRQGGRPRRAGPATLLQGGDTLFVLAEPEAFAALADGTELTPVPDGELLPPVPQMLIETLVPPRSPYAGRTLREGRLRDRTRATVVAVRRGGRLLHGELRDEPLQVGDALLLAGGPDAQRRVAAARDELVVTTRPREWERFVRDTRRAPWALAVLAGLLVAMGFGLLPNVVAVLLAAVLMVLGGAIDAEGAYRAIHWESVVLVAAILPLATALETSGGLDLIVGALVSGLGDAGPRAVMAALFALTALLGQAISNTATAALLAPVAASAAAQLGVAPEPLLITIAVAAATAFATPVASPTNALVLNAGRYRFGDYLRVGVPLIVLLLAVALLVIPLAYPL